MSVKETYGLDRARGQYLKEIIFFITNSPQLIHMAAQKIMN